MDIQKEWLSSLILQQHSIFNQCKLIQKIGITMVQTSKQICYLKPPLLLLMHPTVVSWNALALTGL